MEFRRGLLRHRRQPHRDAGIEFVRDIAALVALLGDGFLHHVFGRHGARGRLKSVRFRRRPLQAIDRRRRFRLHDPAFAGHRGGLLVRVVHGAKHDRGNCDGAHRRRQARAEKPAKPPAPPRLGPVRQVQIRHWPPLSRRVEMRQPTRLVTRDATPWAACRSMTATELVHRSPRNGARRTIIASGLYQSAWLPLFEQYPLFSNALPS